MTLTLVSNANRILVVFFSKQEYFKTSKQIKVPKYFGVFSMNTVWLLVVVFKEEF